MCESRLAPREEGAGDWFAGIRRTNDTYRSPNAGPPPVPVAAAPSPPTLKWSPAHRWKSIFLFVNRRFIVGFVTPLSVVHLVLF